MRLSARLCFPLLESNGIEQRSALWGLYDNVIYGALPWNLPVHVLVLSDPKAGLNDNDVDLCPPLSYSALWV